MDPHRSSNQASIMLSPGESVIDLPVKVTIFSFWNIHSSFMNLKSRVVKLNFKKEETRHVYRFLIEETIPLLFYIKLKWIFW